MATFDSSPDLDPKVAQAIQDAMDSLRSELLAHLEPKAADAAPTGRVGDGLTRLEAAVDALDAADTQTELLASLLQEAGAFAERSLFLVRDGDDLNGWAAFGFAGGDEDVNRVSVACPSEVAARRPADDPAASGAICDHMAAAQAAQSIMVPFTLRGKVAGALYADCSSGGVELDRPALRLLSYIAAQAVETLPLRRAVDEAVATPTVDEVEELVEVEEPAEAEAPAETAPTGEEAQFEAQEAELVADLETTVDADADVDVDVDRMIEEVEPESYGAEADTDIVAIRHDVAPAGFEAIASDKTEKLEADRFDTAVEEIESEEKLVEDSPGILGALPATGDSSTVEPTLDEMAEAARVEQPARSVDDAEVAPPSDLDGPGWAFSGSESISDDTQHEEARRLARLLVTEIKLYNEEKVREGRESSNLYDQLRDDIERSRRIYEERIDDDVREQADYFQEEVVRILAGGDSTALGA